MSSQQEAPSFARFRLATMLRQPPPPPPAAPSNPTPPPPRPTIIRPTFTSIASQPTPTPPPPQPTPTPQQSTPTPTPQQPTLTSTPTSSPLQPTSTPTPQQSIVTPIQTLPPLQTNTTTPPQQPSLTQTPSPQQPTSTPPPQQSTIIQSPQKLTPITSPPRPTPTVQLSPPVPVTNVVESPTRSTLPLSFSPPPTSPSREPPQSSPPTTPLSKQSTPPLEVFNSPPPSLTTTTSFVATTRNVTPPSSPPKIFKPLEQMPPQLPPTNTITPPPPLPPLYLPKNDNLITPPQSSLSRPTPLQQHEHPLPQSSPPKIIKVPERTSPPSPNINPLYEEHNQKTMRVQETNEKAKNLANAFSGSRHSGGIHHHDSTKRPETHKKHSDSEDVGNNIITLAGENKGAIMEVTAYGDKKHEFGNNVHINRHSPTTSNNEENLETDSKAKNKYQKSNSLMKTSFLNSNVQSINNSILYNCTINHHDPGIHLNILTKSDGDSEFRPTEHKKGEHDTII